MCAVDDERVLSSHSAAVNALHVPRGISHGNISSHCAHCSTPPPPAVTRRQRFFVFFFTLAASFWVTLETTAYMASDTCPAQRFFASPPPPPTSKPLARSPFVAWIAVQGNGVDGKHARAMVAGDLPAQLPLQRHQCCWMHSSPKATTVARHP